MMSHFCGCHKLVPAPKDVKMFIAYIVLFNLLVCCSRCLCLCLSLPAGIPMQDDPYYNPLMSSREDMAQIAGYGEEKLSTVLITGSVHCEKTCDDMHPNDDTAQTTSTDPDHDHQPRLHAWPLSGALVSVNCHVSGRNKRTSSFAQGSTDEFGDFKIDLPSNLHAIPDLGKTCSVRVLRIPKSTQCRPAYVRRHKGLKLSSVGNGIRTYNAGKIRFQHLTTKPSTPCINKVSNNERMLS